MCVSKKYRDTSSNNSTIHEFSDDSLYLPITYHIIYIGDSRIAYELNTSSYTII